MTGFIPYKKFDFSIPFFVIALLIDIRPIWFVYKKFGLLVTVVLYVIFVTICQALIAVIYEKISLWEYNIRKNFFNQEPDEEFFIIELLAFVVSVTFLTIGLYGFVKIIPMGNLALPDTPFGIFWCFGFLCYSENILALSQERQKTIHRINE